MVYIKDWPEFQQRSIKLYKHNPGKTRYLVKSHAATQSLTLKVTDDVTTIKFRTRSSAILGRLEIFNKAMTFAMAGSSTPLQDANPEPAPAPVAPASAPTASEDKTASSATAPTAAAGTAGAASASDKKKKKKGKK